MLMFAIINEQTAKLLQKKRVNLYGMHPIFSGDLLVVVKAGGVAYGGLRIGRCARSWATIRKSRVVINPIQTRLADWFHAQRCRTTRLVALTSIVRGPWPKSVASV